jgi:hypothetical protein
MANEKKEILREEGYWKHFTFQFKATNFFLKKTMGFEL